MLYRIAHLCYEHDVCPSVRLYVILVNYCDHVVLQKYKSAHDKINRYLGWLYVHAGVVL